MEKLQIALIGILTLGVLITIHEFGHFWVARRCGVRVLRFSIGFGKPLITWHDRQKTEYTLCPIPLGGYVRMLGENTMGAENDPLEQGISAEERQRSAFDRKTLAARAAIVTAGPAINLLLAVLIYWVLGLAGVVSVIPRIGTVLPDTPAAEAGLEENQEIVAVDGTPTTNWQAVALALLKRIGDTGELQISVRYQDSEAVYHSRAHVEQWLSEESDQLDPLRALGVIPYLPAQRALVGAVSPDSPAERAGLRAGDEIISADGEDIADWNAWVVAVRKRAQQTFLLTVQRDSSPWQTEITPKTVDDGDNPPYGWVGTALAYQEPPPDLLRIEQHTPLEAAVAAVRRTIDLSLFTLEAIGKMVTGTLSSKQLSGPVTIARLAGQAIDDGWRPFLELLALFSLSLGVLNLLPIPILDGGHLLYMLFECVLGRPLPIRVQNAGQHVGLVLILSVMCLALYNDFLRL